MSLYTAPDCITRRAVRSVAQDGSFSASAGGSDGRNRQVADSVKRARTAAWFAAAILIALSVAPGQGQQTDSSLPADAVATGAFAAAPASATSPAQSQLNDYRIGDDDQLAISVWHEPDLSRSVPVRPDGKISLPLVGEMQAAGKSALELQENLREALTQYIKDPSVSVIVAEIRSQRINVVGEVGRPGAFQLSESMGVVDAVALAGGLREFAKRNQIYVLRPVGGGRNIRLNAHYQDVLRGKKNSKDIVLLAHDTVVVP